MPLIIVTGRPCVGKTKFSERLRDYLQSVIPATAHVVLINEESQSLNKLVGYSTSNKEKDIRGALKSAAEHALAPNAFVILDSLNYIKGYRYELYCQARTNRSTHCVVWVACDQDTAISRNKERKELGKDGYDDNILKELWKRFEMPNDSNRWDRPLFKVNMSSVTTSAEEVATTEQAAAVITAPVAAETTAPTTVFKSAWKPKSKKVADSDAASVAPSMISVTSSQPSSSLTVSGSTLETNEDLASFVRLSEVNEKDTDPLLAEIFAHLLSQAAVLVPNSSTVTPLHATADMLYELDRTSQKICVMIMTHQQQGDMVEGTPIQLVEFDRSLSLHRHVSLAELQRFRRQFVKINAQHPPASPKEIGSSFVDFLAQHL